MSDAVLAAVIAAAATLLASLLQFRLSIGREIAAARSQGVGGKRKGRTPMTILFVMLIAAAVGGFALSRWLTETEREEQSILERDLRAQIDQISRTASQLELTRAGARAEIETEVLRKIGTDGVAVMASVSPCRPALVVNPPGSTTPPGVSADAAPPPTTPCSEADANTVTLCATIPEKATVSEIQLFARAAESDEPWSTHRLMPGQEANQARFAAQPLEKPDGPGMKQVCQGFSVWAAQQSRVARMVVRYSL
ncbi:MAG TPA: hypothetical protein VN750_07775 [Steroidobacteraceae bacterium]|nr:hypothetical protein [Steroidobacteraceae bacterium]